MPRRKNQTFKIPQNLLAKLISISELKALSDIFLELTHEEHVTERIIRITRRVASIPTQLDQVKKDVTPILYPYGIKLPGTNIPFYAPIEPEKPEVLNIDFSSRFLKASQREKTLEKLDKVTGRKRTEQSFNRPISIFSNKSKLSDTSKSYVSNINNRKLTILKSARKMTTNRSMMRKKTYDRRFTKVLHASTAFTSPHRILTAHQSRIDSAIPSAVMSPKSNRISTVKHLDIKKSNYPNTRHKSRMTMSRQKSYLSTVDSSETNRSNLSSKSGRKSKSLRIRGSSFRLTLSKTPSFKLEVTEKLVPVEDVKNEYKSTPFEQLYISISTMNNCCYLSSIPLLYTIIRHRLLFKSNQKCFNEIFDYSTTTKEKDKEKKEEKKDNNIEKDREENEENEKIKTPQTPPPLVEAPDNQVSKYKYPEIPPLVHDDKKIDFIDFVLIFSVFSPFIEFKHKVELAYDSYDYDLDGTIGKNDLFATYRILFRPNINDAQVRNLISTVFEPEQKQITFEQFQKFTEDENFLDHYTLYY